MDINDVKNFFDYLSNKVQSGGIQISRFNLSLDRAQMQYFEMEFKRFMDTQRLTDAIKPFLTSIPQTVDANGQLQYPFDYIHWASARNYIIPTSGGATENRITELTNDEIGDVLQSSIVNPTLKYPVMTFYDTYMQFYPKNIGYIKFDYLKRPNVPVWAYTTVNNRPVYDAANSVQLQWGDQSLNEIMYMACAYLGINLSKQDFFQYSQVLKQEEA